MSSICGGMLPTLAVLVSGAHDNVLIARHFAGVVRRSVGRGPRSHLEHKEIELLSFNHNSLRYRPQAFCHFEEINSGSK